MTYITKSVNLTDLGDNVQKDKLWENNQNFGFEGRTLTGFQKVFCLRESNNKMIKKNNNWIDDLNECDCLPCDTGTNIFEIKKINYLGNNGGEYTIEKKDNSTHVWSSAIYIKQSRLLEIKTIKDICGPNWESPNDLGAESALLKKKYLGGYLYYCSLLGMINARGNKPTQTKRIYWHCNSVKSIRYALGQRFEKHGKTIVSDIYERIKKDGLKNYWDSSRAKESNHPDKFYSEEVSRTINYFYEKLEQLYIKWHKTSASKLNKYDVNDREIAKDALFILLRILTNNNTHYYTFNINEKFVFSQKKGKGIDYFTSLTTVVRYLPFIQQQYKIEKDECINPPDYVHIRDSHACVPSEAMFNYFDHAWENKYQFLIGHSITYENYQHRFTGGVWAGLVSGRKINNDHLNDITTNAKKISGITNIYKPTKEEKSYISAAHKLYYLAYNNNKSIIYLKNKCLSDDRFFDKISRCVKTQNVISQNSLMTSREWINTFGRTLCILLKKKSKLQKNILGICDGIDTKIKITNLIPSSIFHKDHIERSNRNKTPSECEILDTSNAVEDDFVWKKGINEDIPISKNYMDYEYGTDELPLTYFMLDSKEKKWNERGCHPYLKSLGEKVMWLDSTYLIRRPGPYEKLLFNMSNSSIDELNKILQKDRQDYGLDDITTYIKTLHFFKNVLNKIEYNVANSNAIYNKIIKKHLHEITIQPFYNQGGGPLSQMGPFGNYSSEKICHWLLRKQTQDKDVRHITTLINEKNDKKNLGISGLNIKEDTGEIAQIEDESIQAILQKMIRGKDLMSIISVKIFNCISKILNVYLQCIYCLYLLNNPSELGKLDKCKYIMRNFMNNTLCNLVENNNIDLSRELGTEVGDKSMQKRIILIGTHENFDSTLCSPANIIMGNNFGLERGITRCTRHYSSLNLIGLFKPHLGARAQYNHLKEQMKNKLVEKIHSSDFYNLLPIKKPHLLQQSSGLPIKPIQLLVDYIKNRNTFTIKRPIREAVLNLTYEWRKDITGMYDYELEEFHYQTSKCLALKRKGKSIYPGDEEIINLVQQVGNTC